MSATEETVSTAVASVPVTEPTSTPTEPAPAQATSPENLERDEKGKFRNPLQPRIDELTRARREAEREAAFWRSRAEGSQPAAPAKPEKPTADKYETYDAYIEALTDWKADEKVNTALDARDKASAEKATAEQRATTWAERKAAFATEMPDNDAVMEASEVPIAAHVAESLLESEEGPRIARHLNDHPELAEKLNAMTPTQAAREIGRLEATLKPVSSAATSTPVPEVEATPAAEKRPTKAPPPVKPIAQGKSTVVDLAKASMDEYVETRRKQGASWARR